MSALIVMEVHARDVVNKMLEEGAKNVNDFEWISQLRLVVLKMHVHVLGTNAGTYIFLAF